MKMFSYKCKNSFVPHFCLLMQPKYQGRDCFWNVAPHQLFSGYLREQPFSSWKHRGESGCRGPSGEIMSSFRKPRGLGQLKYSSHSLQTEILELRGIGLLCFFCGIRESIEILVHPSFCLSPSHMVLSLVPYFSFLFLKISFSGGQNWPFK